MPGKSTPFPVSVSRRCWIEIAQRIASERRVKVGAEVGYQVRFDDRTSKETRIAILTEGILTRRLQSDPTLEGVDAVILDEFHERSIHADLARRQHIGKGPGPAQRRQLGVGLARQVHPQPADRPAYGINAGRFC